MTTCCPLKPCAAAEGMGQCWPTWHIPSAVSPRRAARGLGVSVCTPTVLWQAGCSQQRATATAASNKGRLFAGWCSGSTSSSPQHFSGWQQVVCPYQVIFSYSHESMPETQPPHTFPPPCGHVPKKPHPCPGSMEDPHTPGTAAPHSLEPHKMETLTRPWGDAPVQDPGVTSVLALQPSSRCEIIFQS